MNLNLPGFVSFVAIIGAFSIMGGIALFIYHILERERRIEEKEKTTLSEYEDIIKKAHDQAKELLDKTTNASEKVINQVSNTNQAMNTDLDKILQEMAQKHIQALDIQADMFKKEYDAKMTQLQQAIN